MKGDMGILYSGQNLDSWAAANDEAIWFATWKIRDWQIRDTLSGSTSQKYFNHWLNCLGRICRYNKGPFFDLDGNRTDDKVWPCFWCRGYQGMPDWLLSVWRSVCLCLGLGMSHCIRHCSLLILGKMITLNLWSSLSPSALSASSYSHLCCFLNRL